MKLARFQFGVRTLLIGIGAIALALWAWPKWQYYRTLVALHDAVESSWPTAASGIKGPRGGNPDYARLKSAGDRVVSVDATDAAVDLLVDQLRADDPQVRANAAVVLGQLGAAAKGAVPALVDTLDDEAVVVDSAAFALLKLGETGKFVVHTLISILQDDARYPVLRYNAAVELGKLGEFDAIFEVIKREQAQWATAAFQQMGPRCKEALPTIKAMLSSAQAADRAAALDTLQHMEPYVKEAVALITSMKGDKDPLVREHSAIALNYIKLVKQRSAQKK